MYKRLGLAVLAIILVILAGIALFYYWLQITEKQNASPEYLDYSQSGHYFSLGGEPSGIYLVNSTASFGTFTRFVFNPDIFELLRDGAVIGEPYVSISGTIRNDNDRTLFVPLLANLYNSGGEPVGKIVTTNGHTETLASCPGVSPGETADFTITVKYSMALSRKDIASYDIYLAWEPMEHPLT